MTLAVRLCYLQEDEVRKGWSLRDLPKSQSPEALVLEFQICLVWHQNASPRQQAYQLGNPRLIYLIILS